MTKKNMGLASLALAFLAVAGVGLAIADSQGTEGRRHGRVQRMVQYLGLSEAQQATWKSLHEQHRTETEPLRAEGREIRGRLQDALSATSPDPTAVGTATLAAKQHREKIRGSQKAFEDRLLATLSDEQKTKFEAFKAASGGRRAGFRDHHGPKGNDPDEG